MAKKEILNNDALTLRVNAEPVLDAIEEGLDVVEDTIERAVTVTRNNPYLLAGAFILGGAIAGVVAYKIAVKRTSLRYEDILEQEIAAAKEYYKRLAKDGEYSTPEGAADALLPDEVVDAVRSYQGRERPVPYNKVEPSESATDTPAQTVVNVITNVFENAKSNGDDWDYDRELQIRAENPDSPYVISYDEFTENPEHHEQITITYYARDNILADESDQPIDNTEYVVGDDNLTRFGHGSSDPMVVYIRNEKISTDFEIIHSESSYRKDVLGLDDEEPSLRHSQRVRHVNRNERSSSPRRMRERDE